MHLIWSACFVRDLAQAYVEHVVEAFLGWAPSKYRCTKHINLSYDVDDLYFSSYVMQDKPTNSSQACCVWREGCVKKAYHL